MQSVQTDYTKPQLGEPQAKRNSGELWASILVLLCLLNLIFAPVIWGNRTLLASAKGTPSIMPYGAYYANQPGGKNIRALDAGASSWQTEPYFKITQLLCRQSIVPLWNPYNGLGMPYLANMQSQILFPPSLLTALASAGYGADLFFIFRLFAAGLCTLLFLRLFLPALPALFGGIAFMLTGYLVISLNLPETSASALLPCLILACELLIRRPSARWPMVLLTLSVALELLAGMPEVSFLVITFGIIYALSRIIVDKSPTRTKVVLATRLAQAHVLGFALAAPLLLPFAEYMSHSINWHHPSQIQESVGLRSDAGFSCGALGYLIPWLNQNMHVSELSSLLHAKWLRGYWGITVATLALYSILSSLDSADVLKRIKSPLSAAKPSPTIPSANPSHIEFLTIFFTISSALFLLKRYGCPLVNWLGAFPLANMVEFYKYDEPLLGFCMAGLAAIGVYRLQKWRFGPWLSTAVISISILAVLAVKNMASFAVLAPLLVHHLRHQLISGFFILSLVLILIAALGFHTRFRKFIPYSLIGVLALELAFNFIYPCFYGSRPLAKKDCDPFRGAPFVDFLKQHTGNHDRILGLDNVLFPNWSAAFGLFDTRALDAMYPYSLDPFIHNILYNNQHGPSTCDPGIGCAVLDGSEQALKAECSNLQLDNSPIRRFLSLTSARYVLSPYHLDLGASLLTSQIISQNLDKLSEYFKCRSVTINGTTKTSLFQHPNPGQHATNAVSLHILVPDSTPVLSFSYGMESEASMPGKGDGVEFIISMTDAAGNSKDLFRNYIDPKNHPDQRKWFQSTADLSPYAGQMVTLCFSTGAGPRGDNLYDHAAWSNIGWTNSAKPEPPVKATAPPVVHEIYNREIFIYEISDILPRASLFQNLALVDSPADSLKLLRDPAFNLKNRVIILKSELTPQEKASLGIAGEPNQNASAASVQEIKSYSGNQVKIRIDASHPGLLMLNDTYYPGWKAYVDGKERRILQADYLFRGVLVKPGDRELEFKYEPWTFSAGIIIALSGLGLLLLLVGKLGRTQR